MIDLHSFQIFNLLYLAKSSSEASLLVKELSRTGGGQGIRGNTAGI